MCLDIGIILNNYCAISSRWMQMKKDHVFSIVTFQLMITWPSTNTVQIFPIVAMNPIRSLSFLTICLCMQPSLCLLSQSKIFLSILIILKHLKNYWLFYSIITFLQADLLIHKLKLLFNFHLSVAFLLMCQPLPVPACGVRSSISKVVHVCGS